MDGIETLSSYLILHSDRVKAFPLLISLEQIMGIVQIYLIDEVSIMHLRV